MIVICTKCQAKFRVADDKIGARGAKVRCSRCQTVFLVHPDLGTMPVADGDARAAAERASADGPVERTNAGVALEAPSGAVRAPKREIPTAAAPPRNPAVPPPLRNVAAPPPPPFDPFGGADPFAAPAAAAAPADPFGGADPFAAPAPPPAAPDLGDPFSAAAPRTSLPVTDLSDLLGAGSPPAPPPDAPPPEDPFAAPDGGLALEPAAAPAPPAPFAPPEPFGAEGLAAPEDPFAAAPPEAAPAADDGGLALEDRLTPPPRQVAQPPLPEPEPPLEIDAGPSPAAPPPADPFAGFGAMPGASSAPFDPGAFDYQAEPGEAEPAPEPPPPPARAPAPAPAAPAAAPAPPAAAATPVATPQPERIPGARTSRLRAVAVNAVALVALLAVALALWVVWRSDRPFEAATLRPSAILAALGRGDAAGPWSTHEVRSGVYERERGAPLLFVRGRVASRAQEAVPAVRVAVQLLRAGQVVARGEALAGAIPTPEELYLASDDAALAAVVAAARARAPAQVRPGDSLPFLVAVGDAPPDLEGVSLRIDVAPAPAAAPPAAPPAPALAPATPPAAAPAGGGAP